MLSNQQQATDFIELLGIHERIIHKVCHLYANNAEDYKDLYQEIILQTWLAFPRFRNEAKISTWLYRIALNTSINFTRKNRKNNSIFKDIPIDYPDETLQNSNEEYNLLWQLISKLPQLDRALILLYLEDNSHNEIAVIMGLSVTNVGTKLGRIKEKLKKQVKVLID